MNITPHVHSTPIATAVNVQTDTLRRENNQREIIAKPEAANPSAAEKGAASERERAKTAGQAQEGFDFEALRKHAEEKSSTIDGDGADDHHQQSSQQDGSEHNAELSSAEMQEIKELQARDKEVRAHELAHATVGGSVTGAPNYTFQTGADGKQYAVGGEVSVDLSPVQGDSIATIAKMERIKSAALAPANPSAQDIRIAARASNLIAQEQTKVSIEQTQNKESSSSEKSSLQAENTRINDEEAKVKEEEEAKKAQAQEALVTENTHFKEVFEKLNNTIESVSVFSKNIDVDLSILMERTLAGQGKSLSQRSNEVDERANRIESFYLDVTQAYEKEPSFQFTLTI